MCAKISPIQWAMVTFITIAATKSEDIPDVTLISYKISATRHRMTCVVNGSTDSAIVWNEPLPTSEKDTIKHVSGYIPPRNEKYWSLNNGWIDGRSLGDRYLEPVMDRRWEEFNVHYTSGTTSNDFKYVAYINEADFAVHISLRIKEEAHIYLCDNKYPPYGNCYWIMLGGFSGNKTAIRKCTGKQKVPKERYAKGDCRMLRDETSHSSSDPILNEMEWRHFTIKKKNSQILLWQIGKTATILNYDDQDNYIYTPYLSIKSSGTPGYWKLHDYNYRYTLNEGTTLLRNGIYVQESKFCITMFVAMCSECNLILEVFYGNEHENRYENILSTKTNETKQMAWQEEKIVLEVPDTPTTVNVRVTSVCSMNNCNDPFWAIDKFGICSESEISTVSVDQDGTEGSCQLIKYPHRLVVQTEVQSHSFPGTDCSLGTFGKSCINCSKVLGADNYYCEGSTICEMQLDGQSICRCAAGYNGTACETQCPYDSYGFSCKEKCGYCVDAPCYYITGYCPTNRCLLDFTDSYCKTPPLPVLINPPTVITVGHTYLIVQIQNNSYEGSGSPSTYKIQYKEKSQNVLGWSETQTYDFHDGRQIKLNNLNVLTTYVIRAILFTRNGEAYNKSYVRNTTTTTTCAVIEQNDITIIPRNISATLTFKHHHESCRSEDYEILVNGNSYRRIQSEPFVFNIDNLTPATTYSLSITNTKLHKTLTKGFTTTEGAPEEVEQLSVIYNDTTSITISWKPPLVTNGKIQQYIIQWKHIKYMACGTEQVNDNSVLSLRRASAGATIINKLHPYSEYLIEIVAFTVIKGIPSTISAFTSQTDTPDELEIPSIQGVEPDSTTAKITMQQPNCRLVKGPIVYHVAVECSSSWCLEKFKNNVFPYNNVEPIALSNLQPYCNYTTKIKVGRRNGNIFNRDEITSFTTKTSEPHGVRNLTAYEKNENSVSLRFLPPSPPTGVLSQYRLNYSVSYTHLQWNQQFSPTKCNLWSNFHCVTIHQLKSNKIYILRVEAKNVGTNYGYPENISVHTIQEKPGVVENLTSMWDNYYNLALTWDHPSITNGPLTNFLLTITSERTINCYKEYIPVNENNYTSTYSYKILLKQCYSSNITIRVAAFNIYEGPPAERNMLSPPITPSFSKEPSLGTVTNTTITIKLSAPTNLSKNSVLYVIVNATNSSSKYTNNIKIVPEIWNKLNAPNNAILWIAAEYDFTKNEAVGQMLVIGDGKKSKSKRFNTEIFNQVLHTATNYKISALIINEFGGLERYSVSTIEAKTFGIPSEEQNQSSKNGLFALLLLLLVPVILFVFIRRKNKDGVSWRSMLNLNNNLAPNSRSPDVIPLATKPGKVAPQSQLRPKRGIPITEDANLMQPSTSKASDEFSKPVKIMEFEKYVKLSIENGELEKQHQLFPRGQTKPWDYGLLPQNKSKNRYNNLIAYDHTRVKLAQINNDPYSDYINANYIEGYNTKKAYIATQGPKAATVNDFWRMIWQENVCHIIMLANVIEAGKKKTEQYWPNVDEYLEFGNIKVEYVSSRVFADYEYRTFLISSKSEERKVEQLHFTSWPDHAVPLYSQSLVPFLRKILTIPQGSSPIVVHCSAGVGRTGTIILCDLCLRMAAREGVVDVLKHQQNLREQRANLVDNIEQYKLAHLVLLECLIAPQTSVSCNEEMEGTILRLLESKRVAQQMLYLRETAWQDQSMRSPLKVTPNPEWSTKNRFQDIIPYGYGRVYLSRYPVSDEHSDYINAVEVDGFRCPQRFIVTQQPLPHTISDFWRMIDEKEVTTIVSLNKINLGDETSCVFWPSAKISEIKPVPFLTLEFHSKSSTDYYSVITIYLHNKKDKKTAKRTVTLIILKGWSANKLLPDEEESLWKLWEETERASRGNNPIAVTCYDGVKACGLFIALSFVIEKMKLEQECDVCLAVRTIRHNRKQFVTEIDQFRYLYRAAISYFGCFNLYSNFTSAGKK